MAHFKIENLSFPLSLVPMCFRLSVLHETIPSHSPFGLFYSFLDALPSTMSQYNTYSYHAGEDSEPYPTLHYCDIVS